MASQPLPAPQRERLRVLYSGAVALAGLSALTLAGLRATAPFHDPQTLLWTAALALAGSLSYRFTLHLMRGVKVTLDTLIYVLAILLTSPFHSGIVALSGYLVGTLLLGRRFHRYGVPFGMGLVVLCTVLGGVVYRAVQGVVGVPLASLGGLLAAGAGWGVLFLTNWLGVVGWLGLWEGWRAWEGALRQVRQVFAADLALASVGYLGAVLAGVAPWLLFLLGAPLLAVVVALRQSFRTLHENLELNRRLQGQMEELKRTQTQMLLSARMASVGLLAAGVAHEISNPIFAIQSRAEYLLAHPDRHLASPRAREYLETIREMAVRTAQIVQALLSYSRRSPTGPLDLNEVVHSTLALVEHLLDREAIRIRKELDPREVPVYGNRTALQQVLMNLLTNARDVMPQGGTVTLRTYCEGSLACLEVADTGPGIPPELLDRVFEPFFTTKEVGRGTGLGLYVVRHIVEEHGGRVEVASRPGHGTTFRVLLPLRSTGSPAPAQPASPRSDLA